MATAVRPDIAIHKPNGPLVAVVEIKNRKEMDKQIATILRRNLIAHGALPDVPYFLLLSQDKGYLWKDNNADKPNVEPEREFSMTEVLKHYMPTEIEGRLRGNELEIAVYFWLLDLTTGKKMPTAPMEKELAEAGFIDDIRGANLDR